MTPLRTAALLALPLLLVAGCAGMARDVTTEDVALDGPVRTVEVDTGSGDLLVRHDPTADAPRLVRRIQVWGDPPGATTSQDGDRLTLEGCPGRCSVDYELTLPDADAVVTGTLGSGDAELSGVASADLELRSGSTRLSGVSGPVTVDASSGDVEGAGLSGETTVTSSSGSVALAMAAPASVRVRASSGDVAVTVPAGDHPDATYTVRAATGSGDVRDAVGSTPGAPHTIDVEASSGDVSLARG